jgi:hypothetical protein
LNKYLDEKTRGILASIESHYNDFDFSTAELYERMLEEELSRKFNRETFKKNISVSV